METLRILEVNDKLTTLLVRDLTPRADGKLLGQLLLPLRTHTLWNMNRTDSYPGGVLGEQCCSQRRWGSTDFRELLLMSNCVVLSLCHCVDASWLQDLPFSLTVGLLR